MLFKRIGMKKTSFILLLFIIQSSIGAIAQVISFSSKDSEGNILSYSITSENTVALYKGVETRIKSKTVNVPESVKYKGRTYIVSELRVGCFAFCYFDKLILPNTIKELPSQEKRDYVKGVFHDAGFRNIVLPDNLTIIGSCTFAGCNRLEEVIIPHSVTEIGGGCFAGCNNLRRIKLPSGIKELRTLYTYKTYDECTPFFIGCRNLEEIDIPNSVALIGDGCFYGCEKLKRIRIPDKVEKLGTAISYLGSHIEGCFENCNNLEEVILSRNLKEIGVECFRSCKALVSVKGFHQGIKVSPNSFEGTPFGEVNYTSSFEYFANGIIIPTINEWQKKQEFETTEQYKNRVTKVNQDRKIQELTQEAIREFTAKNPINATLGAYDADNNLYKIYSNYGEKSVKVPLSDAPNFKANFDKAAIEATYLVTSNGLAINDMSIMLNGKKYYAEKAALDNLASTIEIELPDISLQHNDMYEATTPLNTVDHSVDQEIPTVVSGNTRSFAVIIGNEKYTQVAKVLYANNDARIFAEYCKKTLGLPTQNVRLYENATFGIILSAVNDIKKISEAYQGNVNVIFYYAGHGVPNETTKDAYLLPADADGRQTEACYPVSRLYKELGEMGAKNVVVFMDACFSGAQRGEGMLASARGVALKAKAEAPQGNMVVFTAATGDETAYPYNEKGHGMFTYFLLKKLQETKGDCTLGELGEYIQQNVRQQSVVINRKSQTPTITPSANIGDSWKTLKLK